MNAKLLFAAGVVYASPNNVNSSTGSLDPLSLGSVIISKQASLLELKQQIMTLDGLSEFFVPTPFFFATVPSAFEKTNLDSQVTYTTAPVSLSSYIYSLLK